MQSCSLYLWALMFVVSIMGAFSMAVGGSRLRRRPSVTTWRAVIPLATLFLTTSAFVLWFEPKELLQFRFIPPVLTRTVSVLSLLLAPIVAIEFYRLRVIFVSHISPDLLFQTAEAVIARSVLPWQEKTAAVVGRPWWKRPLLLTQENARIWDLTHSNLECWVVFPQIRSRMGSLASVTIRGKGERQKVEPLVDALTKDLRMVVVECNFRQASLGLFAGIVLYVVGVSIVVMNCFI